MSYMEIPNGKNVPDKVQDRIAYGRMLIDTIICIYEYLLIHQVSVQSEETNPIQFDSINSIQFDPIRFDSSAQRAA